MDLASETPASVAFGRFPGVAASPRINPVPPLAVPAAEGEDPWASRPRLDLPRRPEFVQQFLHSVYQQLQHG
jgi:hypothetical protein